jgi:hypothetical protein
MDDGEDMGGSSWLRVGILSERVPAGQAGLRESAWVSETKSPPPSSQIRRLVLSDRLVASMEE